MLEELMRFRPEGLTANGWAVRAGVSRTIWSDLRRHGNPSRRTLEKLLGAAGMTLAEFEALRIGQPASAPAGKGLAENRRRWGAAAPAPIPVLATAIAGEWGGPGSGIVLHSIDRNAMTGQVDRPAALVMDTAAYAMTMGGEAMWPRFRAGRRLLVSPAAQVRVGDDVLVELVEGGALIGEMVSRSPSGIELRQFNPDLNFTAASAGVAAIHKIMGEVLSL